MTFSYSSSNPPANIIIFTLKIYSESASFLLSPLYLPDPRFCLLMFRFLQETSKHSLYFHLHFIQPIDITAFLQTSKSDQMIPLFISNQDKYYINFLYSNPIHVSLFYSELNPDNSLWRSIVPPLFASASVSSQSPYIISTTSSKFVLKQL